jgi:hypothetical protein
MRKVKIPMPSLKRRHRYEETPSLMLKAENLFAAAVSFRPTTIQLMPGRKDTATGVCERFNQNTPKVVLHTIF